MAFWRVSFPSGRTGALGAWMKSKRLNRAEFVVGSRHALGALLAAQAGRAGGDTRLTSNSTANSDPIRRGIELSRYRGGRGMGGRPTGPSHVCGGRRSSRGSPATGAPGPCLLTP